MTPMKCPYCQADLSYEQNGKTYSHVIGVQIDGVYDGVLFWQCPFCGNQWPRFEIGDRLRDEAIRHIRLNTGP